MKMKTIKMKTMKTIDMEFKRLNILFIPCNQKIMLTFLAKRFRNSQ